MAAMSRNNSARAVPCGFSVFQVALGAPLQFLPAVGTKELDDLINAYLPGPAPIQEKRAHVSMDFCEYARLTGETFKFYSTYPPVATDSPASSAMVDSGYGSAFNVSPVMSDLSWSQSNYASPSQARAPSAPSQKKARASTSRKGSSSRAETTNFSHLPGMKIMTKDGVDVTNSASRGCKTKEQRDHAHLMRILKACDSCKRKKIRCDPSHKKRAAASVEVSSEPKPAKKIKKTASTLVAESTEFTPESFPVPEAFDWDFVTAAPLANDTSSFEEPWDQFLQFDEETSVSPDLDYNFFFGPETYVSPTATGSSVSPVQPVTPAGNSTTSPAGLNDDSFFFPDARIQEPTLPYLDQDTRGSNYVDFNLYSPASSFIDEELQPLSKTEASSQSHHRSPAGQNVDAQLNSATNLSTGACLDAPQSPTTLDSSSVQDWSTQWTQHAFDVDEPRQGVPGAQISFAEPIGGSILTAFSVSDLPGYDGLDLDDGGASTSVWPSTGVVSPVRTIHSTATYHSEEVGGAIDRHSPTITPASLALSGISSPTGLQVVGAAPRRPVESPQSTAQSLLSGRSGQDGSTVSSSSSRASASATILFRGLIISDSLRNTAGPFDELPGIAPLTTMMISAAERRLSGVTHRRRPRETVMLLPGVLEGQTSGFVASLSPQRPSAEHPVIGQAVTTAPVIAVTPVAGTPTTTVTAAEVILAGLALLSTPLLPMRLRLASALSRDRSRTSQTVSPRLLAVLGLVSSMLLLVVAVAVVQPLSSSFAFALSGSLLARLPIALLSLAPLSIRQVSLVASSRDSKPDDVRRKAHGRPVCYLASGLSLATPSLLRQMVC